MEIEIKGENNQMTEKQKTDAMNKYDEIRREMREKQESEAARKQRFNEMVGAPENDAIRKFKETKQ
jgi:hypothetical protein